MMTIRIKLLLLFSVTFLSLTLAAVYLVSFYRVTLSSERDLSDRINHTIEIAHQGASSIQSQINSWKNVLLRGDEAKNYHYYLRNFYQNERLAKQYILELKELVKENNDLSKLLDKTLNAHIYMGRKLRESMRKYNETIESPGALTDRYTFDVEDNAVNYFKEIITVLNAQRELQQNLITEQREHKEEIISILVVAVLLAALVLYLWFVDKSILNPTMKAKFLADVMNNAERVANFGTWDWDSETDSHYWSNGLCRILNLDADNLKPSFDRFLLLLNDSDRESAMLNIEYARSSCSTFDLELQFKLAHGEARVAQFRGQFSRDLRSNNVRMSSIVYDITEQTETNKRLTFMANYDSLTELPNRTLFKERVEQALERATRKQTQLAICYLDLDRFKAVNDALGHPVGDSLLVQAAQRISSCLRKSDTVARMGGDEFAILLEDFSRHPQVAQMAESVISALSKSYKLQNNEVFISTSIGITFFPVDGDDVGALIKNAETAMYSAKEAGRSTYHFFTETLNEKASERLLLENKLRNALARDEFELYYQPQIDLSTGNVIGAEALIRWKPDQTLIGPNRFIPVLEDTGLIIPVGYWVLEQACKSAKQWQEKGYSGFRIAVNFSARQFKQADIVEHVERALIAHDLRPECLEVELTESTLLDVDIGQKNLRDLEALGVRIAIDDFGTGYSSLSYLKQYSIDVLKIDKSFIQDINKDRDDDAVTSAIVALSHQLGITVVAEGVETLDQLEFLKKLRCDQAQGFFISHPLSQAQLDHWLSSLSVDEHKEVTWSPPGGTSEDWQLGQI